MSLKEYKKVKYLGKGSYGAAILVHLRRNKQEKFVIKEVVIGHMKEVEKESTMNEVAVLRQMHHSNIAMYKESFIEGSRLYIVMEYADGGDLSGAIARRKEGGTPWPENEIMRIFVQICLALKHVHEHNILHRDLKSQNIFLTSKGIVKMGDFGIAKILDGTDAQARTQIGTPYYLSPEICESRPYGRSSDMWSIGVVLYELMALKLPFTAQSLPALVIKICTADPKWEELESKYSSANVELCQNLLLKDCNSRPNVKEILKSDYLMAHISRLLSYTIKMGKGGAEGAVNSGATVDEVDRDIERERSRQKANEKVEKDKEKLAALHAQHEDEREKLRKFKQEKARQRKKKEHETVEDVVYVPDRPTTMRPTLDKRTQSDVELALAQAAYREEERLKEQQQQYERLLKEQQEKHEEELRRNQKVKGRGNEDSYQSRYEYQDQGNNIVAEKRQSRFRQQSQSSHDESVRRSNRNAGSGYEEGSDEMSAARREFFANRAAAQQIKAKVEAYERGAPKRGANVPSSAMEVALAGGGYTNLQQGRPIGEYRSHGRRHDNNPPYGMHGEGSVISGEERIAQVKAQRKREQEKEAAEKERQLQLAYEETRRERMRIEALRKASAEASESHNYDDSEEQTMSHYERQRRRELRKEEENRKHEKILREATKNNQKRSKEGAVAFSIDFSNVDEAAGDVITNGKLKSQNENVYEPSEQFRSRSNSETSNNDSVASGSSRQRKSWGAPIDGTTVRQSLNSTQADEDRADEEAVLKCLEARNGREEAARLHAKQVFRKLREQKRRENKAGRSKGMISVSKTQRPDPRPPTRPPPTKSADSTPPRHFAPKGIKKTSSHRNSSGGENSNDSVVRSRDASPSSNLARLNDVMGQVAKAQEEVSKVIADARDNNRAQIRDSRIDEDELEESNDSSVNYKTSSTQKTTVRNCYGRTGQRMSLGDDEIFAYSSEDDSDEGGGYDRELEKTLDTWLSKETLKSKKSEHNLTKSMKKSSNTKSLKDSSRSMKEEFQESKKEKSFATKIDCQEAEAKTSPRDNDDVSVKSLHKVDDVRDNLDDLEGDLSDDLDDDGVQDDGEVVEFQCLLANALLNESESNPDLGDSKRDDISL